MKSLTKLEIATLVALYEETGKSSHTHIPRQAVQAHFRKDLRGYARQALNKLVRKGYASKHPKGRQMVYGITVEGIEKLKEMRLALF